MLKWTVANTERGMNIITKRQGRVGLILFPLILASCSQGQPTRTDSAAAKPSPQAPSQAPAQTPAPAQHLSPAGEASLRQLVDSGKLPDLRWPDFSDYRAHIKDFYEPAGYTLAWVRNNQASPQAVAIAQVFTQAEDKGLTGEDYDASRWPARIARLKQTNPAPSDDDMAKFDLAMTVCTMRYISDLHIGKVNPKTFHFGLDIEGKKYKLQDLLRQRLVDLEPDHITAMLYAVEPPFEGYRRMQEAVKTYQDLAKKDDGEQLPVPKKPVKSGDSYAGAPRLVRLLHLVGDLPADAVVNTDPQVYDGALVAAVKHFQIRHGLDPSGRLDADTVKQLNVPLSARLEQLRLTLERWRWAPHEFPRPPIIVNIPEFVLRGWDDKSHTGFESRVVVGKAYHHKTPVFANMMRYVIFRPYWDVPPSIQKSEIVPKLQKDPGYLVKQDLEVYNNKGEVVAASTVSPDVLQQLRAGRLQVRQRPGPKNALGLAKFLFPNEYNVYLHSTPSTELFSRSRRDFSHGCVRVQDIVGLAQWVLRDKPEWTKERIEAAMNGDHSEQINLAKPIPVLILYGTAVALENGEVRFFEDIYGYDAELKDVLAKGYPYPG
jgi:murein L,D-transpeptidase YcbB/YkuD